MRVAAPGVGGAHCDGGNGEETGGRLMATFTVDPTLYQQACEAAAAQGKTVEAFIDETLRQALAVAGLRRTMRNGLPVMMVSPETPAIDPAQVHQWMEEEGV